MNVNFKWSWNDGGPGRAIHGNRTERQDLLYTSWRTRKEEPHHAIVLWYNSSPECLYHQLNRGIWIG